MSDIQRLQELALKFRDERDWKQFHNPKDMAISLVSEATELLNEFQWMNDKEVSEHVAANRESVVNEVMDILFNVLIVAVDLDIDIPTEFKRKMAENTAKYPVEKSKGSHTKYTEL